MNNVISKFEEIVGRQKIKLNEPLSLHTTIRIGGPAEFYVDIDSLDHIIALIIAAKKQNIPVVVLGGGSNIIVSDKGIKGLVIKNNCRKFDIIGMSGKIKNSKLSMKKGLLYCESGAITNQVVRFCIDNGMEGLEYHLGLPGTIGGALCMNSHYPKRRVYVGDTIVKAKIITKDNEIKEVDRGYFRFGYDASVIQNNGDILLSATFALTPLEKSILWERGMEALKYRTDTSPHGSSSGCTFRNISVVDAMRIPTPNNETSAEYLIEKAGLMGRKVGGAMISQMHANYILNTGDAKAEDVSKLAEEVNREVYQKFGTYLHFQIKTIGF